MSLKKNKDLKLYFSISARQKLKDNKETTIRQEEIVNRLKQIKEELLAMKDAFDAFAPKV